MSSSKSRVLRLRTAAQFPVEGPDVNSNPSESSALLLASEAPALMCIHPPIHKITTSKINLRKRKLEDNLTWRPYTQVSSRTTWKTSMSKVKYKVIKTDGKQQETRKCRLERCSVGKSANCTSLRSSEFPAPTQKVCVTFTQNQNKQNHEN